MSLQRLQLTSFLISLRHITSGRVLFKSPYEPESIWNIFRISFRMSKLDVKINRRHIVGADGAVWIWWNSLIEPTHCLSMDAECNLFSCVIRVISIAIQPTEYARNRFRVLLSFPHSNIYSFWQRWERWCWWKWWTGRITCQNYRSWKVLLFYVSIVSKHVHHIKGWPSENNNQKKQKHGMNARCFLKWPRLSHSHVKLKINIENRSDVSVHWKLMERVAAPQLVCTRASYTCCVYG